MRCIQSVASCVKGIWQTNYAAFVWLLWMYSARKGMFFSEEILSLVQETNPAASFMVEYHKTKKKGEW